MTTESQCSKVSDTELTAFTLMKREKTGLKLGYEIGQRYARVFTIDDDDPNRRTVFCFVDLANGNVLKADGWKRPNLKLKNPVRGNLFDEDKGSARISWRG